MEITQKKKKLNNTSEYYLFEIIKYTTLFGMRRDVLSFLKRFKPLVG